ncbi:helix-turn-helix domain-containing protein [Nonomuraea guangzhouensis]|uniref:Helix-turn-helix domain-containing protein n=1 Tax=Nonomuraea guangzhouensis TaxID=1291555 RepID=A0ABW4GZH2_9ACTN|nr:helix-turn-helix domain-containing protein [Nonomuraea guangzhouensis]
MRRDLGQPRPRRERLLKPQAVADQFDVCVRTVIAWATNGRLAYIRTPGGQYRFRPADVDAMVDAPAEVA